jgi:hypothetical protein
MEISLIYLCNEFHVPTSNDSSVITKKSTTTEIYCATTMLFYTPKKHLPPQKFVNISVTPSTEVWMSAMLLLLTARN